jgi:hypothetical protein
MELVGIVLIAAPDLIPGAARLSQWAAKRWRTIENRVRRLFGLPPRAIVYEVGAAGEMGTAGSALAIHSISGDQSVEAKVEFLLRRDQEQQEAIGRLGQRITEVAKESESHIADLRDELHRHVSSELAATAEKYRAVRIMGAVALAVGLGLTTSANFV